VQGNSIPPARAASSSQFKLVKPMSKLSLKQFDISAVMARLMPIMSNLHLRYLSALCVLVVEVGAVRAEMTQ
jgi:hypothetical protein